MRASCVQDPTARRRSAMMNTPHALAALAIPAAALLTAWTAYVRVSEVGEVSTAAGPCTA